MSWFRLDDKAAFHSKMVSAGNEVCGAVWRAGAWCSEHNRSGFVPVAVAHLIASAKVWKRAIAVGMVELVEDGYRIHDFNDYNPTDAEAAALREKKRAAGRAGGLRSGEARSKNEAPASCLLEAPASAPASTSDIPESKQTRSRTHPVPIPEEITPLPSGAGPSPGEPKQKRGSRLPDDWSPNRETLVKLGVEGHRNPEKHLAKFADYWRAAPGSRGVKLDWEATFRNWVRNENSGSRGGFVRPQDITKQPYDEEAPWLKEA